MKSYQLFFIFIFLCLNTQAQLADSTSDSKSNKSIFKDSLDGKLDMSSFLIDYHGFIPAPQIITESALGGIGLMLTPIFITPNKNQTEGKYVPPDITVGFAGYTANKTWGFGGVRMASLPKYHLRYTVGGGYADLNMNFYRDIADLGEQKFSFNIKAAIGFVSLLRQIGETDLFAGMEYLFMNNNISPEFEYIELPDFVNEREFQSVMSQVGFVLEYDKRDNVFTPDKGWLFSTKFKVNDDWTGSDYKFQNLNSTILKYFKFSDRWVSGFRLETKFQFGDAPFYLKPGIALRGVPLSRYQGDQTYVLETEQRYDLSLRWSILGFTGIGKAPIDDVSFSNAELIYNYGSGFRYLIARKFKIRWGMDVAWSNGDFGWYIVFGSAWNNRN